MADIPSPSRAPEDGSATGASTAGSSSTPGMARYSKRRLQYRPKPYRMLQQIAEESRKARKAYDERMKENSHPNSNVGWLSSRRQCVAPDFYLDPVKDRPPNKSCQNSVPHVPDNNVPRPERRYCCQDCYKWYHDPTSSKEEIEKHVQRSARHKQPRSKTPPGLWDIDFSDSD